MEYGRLTINEEDYSITFPFNADGNNELKVYGLDDTGKKENLRFQQTGNTKPLNGYVIFHGDDSTCIMFRSGDLTEFAPGYRFKYEDKSTTETLNLAPTHLRYEFVGKNILTEVELWTTHPDGSDDELLFKGRYNGARPSKPRHICTFKTRK